METAELDTDLSLFKYDNLEQLPPAYRDLEEAERTERIEAALAELGDDVVILGHNYQRRTVAEPSRRDSSRPHQPSPRTSQPTTSITYRLNSSVSPVPRRRAVPSR